MRFTRLAPAVAALALAAPAAAHAQVPACPAPIDAKRLYIADYVASAADAQGDDQADPGDPAAQDPTPDDGRITTLDVEVWIHLHVRF